MLETAKSDRRAREAAIVRYIESTVDVDRQRVLSLPSRSVCDLYERENNKFLSFVDRIGSVLPSGHVVALYIIDMFDRGASLNEIATAVEAIGYMFEMAKIYLDWLPIHAALDFIRERS
jgi:hypothetical protein